METAELETDQHKTESEAGTAEKRNGANSKSEVLNDEEKTTEAVARASLEVLKQASKILVPPTL